MNPGEMTEGTLQEALRLIEAHDDHGMELLRTIASRGDPSGLFILADLTWSGTMTAKDPVRARTLFEYAAAYGHVEANLLATNLLASGIAGKRDWPAAIARLQREAAAVSIRRTAAMLVGTMELDANGDPLATPEPRRLSEQPDAVLFERLLTPAECAYLIEQANHMFEPSMVYNESGQLVRDNIRTSDGATIHWLIEDPAIVALNRRIAAATRTAYEDGEALQVLRYVPGQQYRPHFDWLNDAPNQRIWTALVYLNEDYEGGATAFVRTGLEVRGKTGDVLVFSNAAPDGHGDPLAEHAGLPVTSGTKYLATRWIREAKWIP